MASFTKFCRTRPKLDNRLHSLRRSLTSAQTCLFEYVRERVLDGLPRFLWRLTSSRIVAHITPSKHSDKHESRWDQANLDKKIDAYLLWILLVGQVPITLIAEIAQ